MLRVQTFSTQLEEMGSEALRLEGDLQLVYRSFALRDAAFRRETAHCVQTIEELLEATRRELRRLDAQLPLSREFAAKRGALTRALLDVETELSSLDECTKRTRCALLSSAYNE